MSTHPVLSVVGPEDAERFDPVPSRDDPPEGYVPSELASRIVRAVGVHLSGLFGGYISPRIAYRHMDRAAWAVDKILVRVGVSVDNVDSDVP
jgi:hypothetical protein